MTVLRSSSARFFGFSPDQFDIIELGFAPAVVETKRPTCVFQGLADVVVIARAPTIIEGKIGQIFLDAYAPVLVSGSISSLCAKLRDNAAIEASTGGINVIAADYLDGVVRGCIGMVNGEDAFNAPRFFSAPFPARGRVMIDGSVGDITFRYDSRSELYLR